MLSPELTALRALHPGAAAQVTYTRALTSFADELAAISQARGRLRAGADPISTVRRLQRELKGPERIARQAWTALAIPACQA